VESISNLQSNTPLGQAPNAVKPPIDRKKIIFIVLGVLIAAGAVLGIASLVSGKTPQSLLKPIVGDIEVPVGDQFENPLTGVQTSGGKAKDLSTTRPLAVMINNHVDARPQSGLIDADLVYEIVAEGGITRFLAFFLSKTPDKVGPIRSTREYYLVLVKELGDAMLMHIGWSPQALAAIESWPVRSLGRGAAPFYRENPRNVATEHTAYSDGKKLRERGNELGWQGTSETEKWLFKEDLGGYSGADSATELTVDFWFPGDYSAIWNYDSASNSYLRSMGYDVDDNPVPHYDDVSGDQISAKNVIVQFANESGIIGDAKSRLEYELIGSGDGLVFMDGVVVEVTWAKEERDARTRFYDLDGNEMEFNRGKFWIGIVPARNTEQVKYK
jgi:hypothetical protein